MSDELTKLTAGELAQLIRARQISPVEVVQAHLDYAEKFNPLLNAIVTFAPDAMERARAAEQQVMRGEALGTLHGVPLTIKDTIETAGLLTTSGSRVRARFIPQRDASSVARLKRAGAIIFGKTNVSEMALTYESDNPVFGRSNNPHDVARTPGGSSGGCAAAVGACLSPAGLGSDLVGSIRVPAHFCGIAGLKPTAGVIPIDGHFPACEGAFALGASIGPLARRVRDLKLIFDALMQADERGRVITSDARQRHAEDHAAFEKELQGSRIGWYVEDGVAPVTKDTRRAIEMAARAFGEAGCVVVSERPPGIEQGFELCLRLFQGATADYVRAVYLNREEEAGAAARAVMKSKAVASQINYERALGERNVWRARLLEWMQTTPLIIAPVGSVPAFAHGTRKVFVEDESGKRARDEEAMSVFRAFSFSQTFNVYGLPVAVVPVLRSEENLPIGVQIIGRPFEEQLVLAAARVVEEAFGGWQPPPAFALSPDGDDKI
ncbi:MAG: amidase [Pyrinomonadaceae bacterium]|nr:amidase [Pyrinomonadaceae bacterium]